MGASFHAHARVVARYGRGVCVDTRTRDDTTTTGSRRGPRSKATLAGEEISYFCSGKSVAPVSEAAKGEPRTIDRVRASFFVSSSRDPAFFATLPPPLSLSLSLSLKDSLSLSVLYTHAHTPTHDTVRTDTVLHVVRTDYLSFRHIVAFFPRFPVSQLSARE